MSFVLQFSFDARAQLITKHINSNTENAYAYIENVFLYCYFFIIFCLLFLCWWSGDFIISGFGQYFDHTSADGGRELWLWLKT